MLENLGSAGWGAFPAGTVLELKEASKTAGENPQAYLLNFADKQADLLILGQTLTADVGDSGSRALGDVHYSVRADIIEAAANWAARVINGQLIAPICRLNFGNEADCPYLQPESEEATDAKAMAERDEILIRAGMPMPKAWFYDRHDVPVPKAGEEVIEPPTPQLALPGGADPTMALARCGHAPIAAKSATDQLIDHVLENLTGVQARWLGGVKPYFRGLIAAAQNENLTDDQFVRVLEQARAQLPELFAQLDHRALEEALEAAMGSAMVNGAVQGATRRRLKRGGAA
jgi:phage gp29-like protein